ncbi:hypothetical protein GCM10027345_25370 [Hymenobacter daeguensis]
MVMAGGSTRQLTAQAVRRPGQAQAAGQFLRAVLRADYPVAYSRLAPEVRQTIGLSRFEAQARPLWKSGQQHGKAIELYKLGMRLSEHGASRLFYSFSFAADSSLKTPSVLLEVTFRDTAARAVLGFGLRPTAGPAGHPTALPPKTIRRR